MGCKNTSKICYESSLIVSEKKCGLLKKKKKKNLSEVLLSSVKFLQRMLLNEVQHDWRKKTEGKISAEVGERQTREDFILSFL